jgi:hypothetical protein
MLAVLTVESPWRELAGLFDRVDWWVAGLWGRGGIAVAWARSCRSGVADQIFFFFFFCVCVCGLVIYGCYCGCGFVVVICLNIFGGGRLKTWWPTASKGHGLLEQFEIYFFAKIKNTNYRKHACQTNFSFLILLKYCTCEQFLKGKI